MRRDTPTSLLRTASVVVVVYSFEMRCEDSGRRKCPGLQKQTKHVQNKHFEKQGKGQWMAPGLWAQKRLILQPARLKVGSLVFLYYFGFFGFLFRYVCLICRFFGLETLFVEFLHTKP